MTAFWGHVTTLINHFPFVTPPSFMGLVTFMENVSLSPFLPTPLCCYLHFLTKQRDTEDFKNFLNPGVDHMAF